MANYNYFGATYAITMANEVRDEMIRRAEVSDYNNPMHIPADYAETYACNGCSGGCSGCGNTCTGCGNECTSSCTGCSGCSGCASQ